MSGHKHYFGGTKNICLLKRSLILQNYTNRMKEEFRNITKDVKLVARTSDVL